MTNDVALQISVVNHHENTITVWMEPWGDEFKITSGQALKLMAKGPENGTLEIQYSDRGLMVWGWEGSVLDAEVNL